MAMQYSKTNRWWFPTKWMFPNKKIIPVSGRWIGRTFFLGSPSLVVFYSMMGWARCQLLASLFHCTLNLGSLWLDQTITLVLCSPSLVVTPDQKVSLLFWAKWTHHKTEPNFCFSCLGFEGRNAAEKWSEVNISKTARRFMYSKMIIRSTDQNC